MSYVSIREFIPYDGKDAVLEPRLRRAISAWSSCSFLRRCMTQSHLSVHLINLQRSPAQYADGNDGAYHPHHPNSGRLSSLIYRPPEFVTWTIFCHSPSTINCNLIVQIEIRNFKERLNPEALKHYTDRTTTRSNETVSSWRWISYFARCHPHRKRTL